MIRIEFLKIIKSQVNLRQNTNFDLVQILVK